MGAVTEVAGPEAEMGVVGVEMAEGRENEDFVYMETQKVRVLSILRANLDDVEYAKALEWLNSETSEAFASEDDNLLVS